MLQGSVQPAKSDEEDFANSFLVSVIRAVVRRIYAIISIVLLGGVLAFGAVYWLSGGMKSVSYVGPFDELTGKLLEVKLRSPASLNSALEKFPELGSRERISSLLKWAPAVKVDAKSKTYYILTVTQPTAEKANLLASTVLASLFNKNRSKGEQEALEARAKFLATQSDNVDKLLSTAQNSSEEQGINGRQLNVLGNMLALKDDLNKQEIEIKRELLDGSDGWIYVAPTAAKTSLSLANMVAVPVTMFMVLLLCLLVITISQFVRQFGRTYGFR